MRQGYKNTVLRLKTWIIDGHKYLHNLLQQKL